MNYNFTPQYSPWFYLRHNRSVRAAIVLGVAATGLLLYIV
jgi:hypothetical protein